MKLDLQHNDLPQIPRCLLELPSLNELNLSHNKLSDIPDVPEWSSCLTVMDLSYNNLQSMPLTAVAPSIRALNISHNQFRTVPLCICSFTSLHTLDLSDNPDILSLPAEMGRLTSLTRLYLRGLKDLNDPPRNIQRETRDCIRYLHSKLRCAKGFYKMKLMLVGLANRGKTTLVARLQGKECGDESTVGVDVSEWLYKPSIGRRPFQFSIWDFGGQEEYYATHQCFLSQRSLYLLLFNLKHGEGGVQELKPWLNNIALRAPRSCVIIVGTHLDEVEDEEREEVDNLLQKVGQFATAYSSKVQIVEVIPVGLKKRIENVGLLKEAIYNHAANYKTRGGQVIMGQKIPASYHALDKQLETVQTDVRYGHREPIMHAEEFKTMVQQMNLADIQDDEELKTATLFLGDVGSLLHYDDRSHNLNELYFVDPRWLCDMMAKVVTIRERNPFVKKGILSSKDIPMLFKDDKFPWQYFEQYLTLLDRFEIALPLDNKQVLIPSMLPDIRPESFEEEESADPPLYSRFIMFNAADTPPGFWSRLLSRIMHSVPQVGYALTKTLAGPPQQPQPQPPPVQPDLDISFSMSNPLPRGDAPLSETQSVQISSVSTPIEVNAGPTSLPQISNPVLHNQIQAPLLLPNYPGSLPHNITSSFDVKHIKLEYWRTGLFYADPEVMFRIESLTGCRQFRREIKDGVLIVASPNNFGKKIIGQLVDLVVALVGEWYPGLQEGTHGTSGLDQKVPCYECLKLKRAKPFEFRVEMCLPKIALNQTSMECGYFRDDPAKNHTVSLADIVPDLLLHDIDPEFLLNASDILYNEDESSLLGKGGYGKVYRGKTQGKSVAIKKYLTRNEDAFTELRSEAKLLQKSHHPCLVCLVGVCVHPIMALVMEEAPMGSLEKPIMRLKTPVHRLTMFRIAGQVAAALRFLHSTGIIFRDLKAANVLLWTLDPGSLCHCKVTDFGIATHYAPGGVRGLQGTKGFIAPEVLYIGKRKQRSVYDHKADIFSFSMLLYQLIARRHPYHDIQPQRIDVAVESGDRPRLQDVNVAHTGYHYLTQLMKTCWEDNPKNRPSTDEIIKKLSLCAMQSVMAVHPMRSKFSLRRVCPITPTDFTYVGVPMPSNYSELWVCCDGAEGAEINIYDTNKMVKIAKHFIRDNQVQCIALCGDHIWIGSRAGIEYGVIDIFNISNRELVHNIRMRENSVSCICCSDTHVYLGTLEGYCFAFNRDLKRIQASAKPRYKYVSEHAVDGIACTTQCVWVAHTRHIYFLNRDSLILEGSIYREKERNAFIGQLSPSPDGSIIWSAHLGGRLLSAWDANKKMHLFDIDTESHLRNISEFKSAQDVVITAMMPALDTVWVGMASGHILIFDRHDLLSWYHPYTSYVRFLTCIPSSGPCELEQCMILSGAKEYQTPIPKMMDDYDQMDEKGQPVDKAGVLILWEAFKAKTMHQIKLLEDHSPEYLDDHNSVRKMIIRGEFKDGTHIKKGTTDTDLTLSEFDESQPLESPMDSFKEPYIPESPAGYELTVGSYTDSFQTNQTEYTMGGKYDSLRNRTLLFSQPGGRDTATNNTTGTSPITGEGASFIEELPELEVGLDLEIATVPRMRTATIVQEVFDIRIPETDNTVRVLCPKPAKLKVILSELQVNAGIPEDDCRLEYRKSDSGEVVKISKQEHLERYLKLGNKPQLLLSPRKAGTTVAAS